jgi:hypothetical protein
MIDELPEELTDPLEDDLSKELMQRHVLEVLYEGDRAFYSLSQVSSSLDASRETVRDRLNEMVELDVLKKDAINNGDIWWINRPESEHPVPPDVTVHPEKQEETVSEFFSQIHIRVAGIALLCSVVGGILVWLGVLGTSVSLPFTIPTDLLIAYGLATTFVSYILFLLFVIVWVMEKSLLPEGESITVDNLLDRG